MFKKASLIKSRHLRLVAFIAVHTQTPSRCSLHDYFLVAASSPAADVGAWTKTVSFPQENKHSIVSTTVKPYKGLLTERISPRFISRAAFAAMRLHIDAPKQVLHAYTTS